MWNIDRSVLHNSNRNNGSIDMKINSEDFKEIMCKANRIVPNAKIKFKGRSWVSASKESDSQEFTYNEINKIEIWFADDRDESNVIAIHLKC
jgi:hypothetical protein